MLLKDALSLAVEWIRLNEASLPGYVGAYAGGSCAVLSDEDAMPDGSDLDVFVALTGEPPAKRGKFLYGELLMEISYLSEDALFPADRALSDYHLAHSLAFGRLLSDPSGKLGGLMGSVRGEFAKPEAIRVRRDHALSRVKSGLTAPLSPCLPDRTLGWLFPTGITTHAVLVSAMQNPTVRLRYLRAREIMERDDYEALLSLSGFAHVTRIQAAEMLGDLMPLYDRASFAGPTPFFFASDVSPQSRRAVEELENLIQRGDHREALFWILTTYARSMKILSVAETDACALFQPAFDRALETVGRDTEEKILAANRAVLDFLPELTRITDGFIARHAKP